MLLAGCAARPQPTALKTLQVAAAPDANFIGGTQLDVVFAFDAPADADLPPDAAAWFVRKPALRANHPTLRVLELQLPADYPLAGIVLQPGFQKAVGVYAYASYLAAGEQGRCTLTRLVHVTVRLQYNHADCTAR